MIFRKLKADEIECRIGSVTKTGITLLLYKDARCDMNILDETVGAENWERMHREVKGTVYCGVGIRCKEEDTDFSHVVWKWDAGAESYTEKEKGEASDSFKRACVNWGIGRELYTSPLIFIRAKTEPQGNGYRLEDKRDGYGYKVAEIDYLGGRIANLKIAKDGAIVFSWQLDTYMQNPGKVGENEIAKLSALLSEERLANAIEFYGLVKLEDMTMEQYSDCIRRLSHE